MKKPKGISRIDQESKLTFGWYSRVTYNKKIYSKFFSDKKCGGRNSALLEAVAWLRNTHKRLKKIDCDKRQFTASRTATGVVGVTYDSKLDRFLATWYTPGGKAQKTSVSCKKHGDRKAFAKACAIRKEKEAARLMA